MTENSTADPAAIFCCAVSLRDAATPLSEVGDCSLSDAYSGWNGFLQEVMRVATLFETWATEHVAFDHLVEVWPYFMEERFGDACVKVADIWALASFDEMDCLRIAQQLQLPLYYGDALVIPLEVHARNTVVDSGFTEFGIQTVRIHRVDAEVIPFVCGDDPWDEDYDFPRLALCGITAEGQREHIADFATYREAVSLVKKLAPGIDFPERPVVTA
jgi:hypothetical protein